MEISVQQADPALNDTRPHYCAASGRFVGLRIGSGTYMDDVYCPWCGIHVPIREPNRDYARTVRPEQYSGPRCAHGYPDIACRALADDDEKARFELSFGAIREFRAAELARRYAVAPAVESWVRPCPQCRREVASRRAPLLKYQLGKIARALREDLRAAEAAVQGFRDDLRWLNEAFRELFEVAMQRASDPERIGFVYLIGHDRAVKIGWSDRHPAASGGRLAELQIGSCDELEILGLIEGGFSLEREIQGLFSKHRLRGEWFRRDREILDYFVENGTGE